MRITPIPSQSRAKLREIAAEVKRTELRFISPEAVHDFKPEAWKLFYTAAPRLSIHEATPPELLLPFLENNAFPRDEHFADLGAGLGMASFSAAAFYDNVTGFEYDPLVCGEAERIARQFGIKNVLFRQEDFTKADLSRFSTLFIYKPFFRNFDSIMRGLMEDLMPGTKVICRRFIPPVLDEARLFTPLACRGSGEFFAYQRT